MDKPVCSCCGCWMDAPGVCVGCWAHQRDERPCDQSSQPSWPMRPMTADRSLGPEATRRAMRDGGGLVARVLTGSASYDEAQDVVVKLSNERMALRTYLYRMFAAIDDADERLMRLLAGRKDAWGLIDQIEDAKQAYTDYLDGWPAALAAMEVIEHSESVRRAKEAEG